MKELNGLSWSTKHFRYCLSVSLEMEFIKAMTHFEARSNVCL
jgi:hypothetical protein